MDRQLHERRVGEFFGDESPEGRLDKVTGRDRLGAKWLGPHAERVEARRYGKPL